MFQRAQPTVSSLPVTGPNPFGKEFHVKPLSENDVACCSQVAGRRELFESITQDRRERIKVREFWFHPDYSSKSIKAGDPRFAAETNTGNHWVIRLSENLQYFKIDRGLDGQELIFPASSRVLPIADFKASKTL